MLIHAESNSISPDSHRKLSKQCNKTVPHLSVFLLSADGHTHQQQNCQSLSLILIILWTVNYFCIHIFIYSTQYHACYLCHKSSLVLACIKACQKYWMENAYKGGHTNFQPTAMGWNLETTFCNLCADAEMRRVYQIVYYTVWKLSPIAADGTKCFGWCIGGNIQTSTSSRRMSICSRSDDLPLFRKPDGWGLELFDISCSFSRNLHPDFVLRNV